MDSLDATHTSTPQAAPNNSWGAIISIVLILGIVVAGAYYAFTDRTTPVTTTEASAE